MEYNMEYNFERLTTGISQINKKIQKIKKHKMEILGLKGTHVMCLYYLTHHPEGLTASDLCDLCKEDKAGISRILQELETGGYLYYDIPDGQKKYRSKATLTQKGRICSAKVNELVTQAALEAGRGITEEERQTFYRVLSVISENLDRMCTMLDKNQ